MNKCCAGETFHFECHIVKRDHEKFWTVLLIKKLQVSCVHLQHIVKMNLNISPSLQQQYTMIKPKCDITLTDSLTDSSSPTGSVLFEKKNPSSASWHYLRL